MNGFKYYVFFLLLLLTAGVKAQPGLLDPTFRSPLITQVLAVCIQPDGKILIGGGDYSVGILRLEASGRIDTTFKPGTGTASSGYVFQIAVQPDGKIILAGGISSYNGVTRNKIARLHPDGSLDTSFTTGVINGTIRALALQPDGKVLIGGEFTFCNNRQANRLARLNADGSTDLSFLTSNAADNRIQDIQVLPQGQILITGSFSTYNGTARYAVARLNSNGTLDPTFNIGFMNQEVMTAVRRPDGKFLIGGYFNTVGGRTNNLVAQLHSNGTVDTTFRSSIDYNISMIVHSISLQPDGKIIAGGSFTTVNGVTNQGIVRLNPDGSHDMKFKNGTGTNYTVYASALQSDGRVIIGGQFNIYNSDSIPFAARLYGDRLVYGKVFMDLNRDGHLDSLEPGIAEKRLMIQPGNFVVQTYSDGNWSFDSLPAGNYTVTVDTSGPWVATNPTTQNFRVVSQDTFTYAGSFGFVSNYPCPAPDVSIVMPRIRRGFANQLIYVDACNLISATDLLNNAYCIIKLDTSITVNSASVPYTDLGNHTYRVDLGTLSPGQCASFSFTVTVGLGAVLGQTLCMSAELYPRPACVLDSVPTPPAPGNIPCAEPFDASHLVIKGWCQNDSLYFVVTNDGEDMLCPTRIRIFVDAEYKYNDTIFLASGESKFFVYPGDGKTWRMEADQHLLHPGESRPSASIERCGNLANWTPGMILTLPQDDADPVIDIFCGPVRAAQDPNDKTGFPLGVGNTHTIHRNQEIEYLIRFQNVGTDTAENVVIRDTLSTDLDIFSVRSGVSSHPYHFRMYGARILEWTFSSIQLPDSSSGEAASHGFIKFNVKQQPDLPYGTIINNRAGIYFDFEEPVITNTYFHTVSPPQTMPIATIVRNVSESVYLYVIPNPFSQTATIEIEGLENYNNLSFEMYNLFGQTFRASQLPDDSRFEIERGDLPGGVYFFQLKQNNRVISNGKMVVN